MGNEVTIIVEPLVFWTLTIREYFHLFLLPSILQNPVGKKLSQVSGILKRFHIFAPTNLLDDGTKV